MKGVGVGLDEDLGQPGVGISTGHESGTRATAALLVSSRGAQLQTRLGMKSDAKEIPDFIDWTKDAGWWLTAGAYFEGQAAIGDESGEVAKIAQNGTSAMSIGHGRLIGILSPASRTDPAVWWSWTRTSIEVEAAGSQGTFKKRPTDITLKCDGSVLRVKEVSRLYRHASGRIHAGEELSFLKALGARA